MDGLHWLLGGVIALQAALIVRAIAAARRQRRQSDADQRQARGALQALEVKAVRLRQSLSGVGQGVFVLDADRRIVDCNTAAIGLAGLPERPIGARSVTEVLPWGQLHAALETLKKSDAEVAAEAIEFELANLDADQRSLVVRVRSLGELGYVIGITDHSRIKQLESLRRDFVANVSHELKTPLAAIKGFVETLRDDAAMPEATRQRFLERISTQSERLNSLVGDLLTLSRLDEAGDAARSFQPCDLSIVVEETIRDLMSLAERKGIRLATDAPEGPLFVRAEREGLRQVISNLVDNAIKYTPEDGRIGVVITARPDQLRLEVTDTGIGLSPADQRRVFERFYRVDGARSRELGGTGLGLSIVKNIVRGIGGDVGVESALGRGSTFWVTLPRLLTARR